MHNKFAIIIPVYNAEKYLSDCLESLLAQTYRYWEAICINDGSTDRSGDILLSYAIKDERIKIYHTANGGAGAARNFGLSKVPSDAWISFIDSDDYVSKTMYEDINRALAGQDVDYIRLYYNTTHERYAGQPGQGDHTWRILNREAYFKHGDVGGYICSIIVKASIVRGGELSFNKHMRILEDQLFSIQCALNSQSIMLYTKRHYYYYTNPTSITKAYNDGGKDILLCINELYKSCQPYLQANKSISHYFWKRWLPKKLSMYLSFIQKRYIPWH